MYVIGIASINLHHRIHIFRRKGRIVGKDHTLGIDDGIDLIGTHHIIHAVQKSQPDQGLQIVAIDRKDIGTVLAIHPDKRRQVLKIQGSVGILRDHTRQITLGQRRTLIPGCGKIQILHFLRLLILRIRHIGIASSQKEIIMKVNTGKFHRFLTDPRNSQ